MRRPRLVFLRRSGVLLADRIGYTLAALPVLTDWLDTGHWPQHPRELATEVIVGLVILLGVTRLYRRAERFRALSQTDALTGVGNRARFRVDLEAAAARAREDGTPLALAIVDVDDFKQVNDTFGHAAGDRVLREVAGALERAVRQGVDGCYRLGGDEFAVLMEGVRAEGLHQALRRSFGHHAGLRPWSLTCSVGIVTLGAREHADELVHRADALMYRAKRGLGHEASGALTFERLTLGSGPVAPERREARRPQLAEVAATRP